MKKNGNFLKFILIAIAIAASIFVFSACSNKDSEADSIVMIKNRELSTYGTGFAVGIPGEPTEVIITSYSVIATKNGSYPRTALVRTGVMNGDYLADVIFGDSERNIAILKLHDPTKDIKPMLIKKNSELIKGDKSYYVCGYDGTGNIMSNFEQFNKSNTVKRYGEIVEHQDIKTMTVYSFSEEFNRAMVGAPAFDQNGNVLGMCAYSLDNMNTYSQYILANREIIQCLDVAKVDYMTYEEYVNRYIILGIAVLGALILIINILLVFRRPKKENNLIMEEKHIYILGGRLAGHSYSFTDSISIGRNDKLCKVVYPMDARGISGHHCTIYHNDGKWYLKDNNSSYGLFTADGARILPSMPMMLPIGTTEFYLADPVNMIRVTI